MKKIGVNGFGRIGRCFTRVCLEREDVDVADVNDLADIKTLAHLFKYDSIHGKLKQDFKIDGNYLRDRSGNRIAQIDGKYIRDSRGNRAGEIDGRYIRDSRGNRIAELDGIYVRDSSGNRICEIDNI